MARIPADARPPKKCAEDRCEVEIDRRATRCRPHAAERAKTLRQPVNAKYYDATRNLMEMAVLAYDVNGAVFIPIDAARRLAKQGDLLAAALAERDGAERGDRYHRQDPDGRIRRRAAQIDLDDQTLRTSRLLSAVLREIAR